MKAWPLVEEIVDTGNHCLNTTSSTVLFLVSPYGERLLLDGQLDIHRVRRPSECSAARTCLALRMLTPKLASDQEDAGRLVVPGVAKAAAVSKLK